MPLTGRDALLSSSAAALTASIAHSALAQTSPSTAAMQRADELLRQMTIEEKAMQLFLRRADRRARPRWVEAEPGASKTVSFVVPMSLLPTTGLSGDVIMEPGPVEVSAGSSSSDIRSNAKLTVTGKTRVIKGEDRAFLSVATVAP
jgi:hypothetical protein